jgi:hypothetical protein
MVSLDLTDPEVRPLNLIFLGADRVGWLKGKDYGICYEMHSIQNTGTFLSH